MTPNLVKTLTSASKTKNTRQDGNAEVRAPTQNNTKKTWNKHMDKDKEPKGKGSTTKKPKLGQKNHETCTNETDSGSSANNHDDSSSHTRGETSEWV